MNRVSPGLLALLTLAQIEAWDDLEHNCDLIHCRPNLSEIDWTLQRAGVTDDVRAVLLREAAT